MSYSDPVKEVLQMGKLKFTGNIIPEPWYRHLKFDSGKPNLNAIIILSEIVYWYRPVEIRDEHTGQFIGYHQKFKSDKLQRSYQSLSDKFGLTKRQVKDACHFLQAKNLISLELKTVPTASGANLGNVLFIGINNNAIAGITYSNTSNDRTSQGQSNGIAMTSQRDRGDIQTSEALCSNEIAMTLKRQTYTKITTENSTKTSSLPPTPQGEEKEKPNAQKQNPQSTSLNTTASLTNQSDCLEKETNPGKDQSSAAAPGNVKKSEASAIKYDPALGMTPPSEHKSRQQRSFDWVAFGPWLINGKLDPNFVDWQARDWQKVYGGDLHRKRADVLRHFKKDPANLAIAWEQYRSEQHHRYSNAALRMQNGLKIQAEEQRQLLAHKRAITEALPDEINPVAVGQNRGWQGQHPEQPVLPEAVVAFPSKGVVASNTDSASQNQCDQKQNTSFSSSLSSVNSQQSSVNKKQASLLRSDCSLDFPTDSDGMIENSNAYKLWKPQPIEGEPINPLQFKEKLAQLSQNLSMHKSKQKPQVEPKNELEELNQWLADPILRKEVMPRVMRSERYTVEFDEQGEAIRVVEVSK